MGQILLGVLAFALAFAFDWVSWLRVPRLKPLLGVAVILSFGAALAWTLSASGRYDWPGWTPVAGWPLLVAGTALLVYSLFIEIPFIATYARQGVGDTLVKSGTYALVRHPGVLWFALWVLGCVLVTRARLMLVAGAVWLVLDIIYVWLQERFLFSKMFPGYGAYQQETPMLVPTPRSLAQCLRTWPQRPPASRKWG